MTQGTDVLFTVLGQGEGYQLWGLPVIVPKHITEVSRDDCGGGSAGDQRYGVGSAGGGVILKGSLDRSRDGYRSLDWRR
jgi:hypothetical protein